MLHKIILANLVRTHIGPHWAIINHGYHSPFLFTFIITEYSGNLQNDKFQYEKIRCVNYRNMLYLFI